MPPKVSGTLAPPHILHLQYALTAAAGALDVFCVTRLGGAFASIITGNLIQVGSATVSGNPRLAISGAVAVGSYAVGVACGAIALRHTRPGWTHRTTQVIAAEFLLLAILTAVWRESHTGAGAVVTAVLLGVAALAMGLQSAASVTSGLPGASTTYLTGILTQAIHRAITEAQGLTRGFPSALRLAALLAGAVAGGLMQQLAPAWAPALPAAIVGLVAAVTPLRGRDRIAS